MVGVDVIFLLKRSHSAGLNFDHSLGGLEPYQRSIGSVAIGMDAEAVRKHDELASLGRSASVTKHSNSFMGRTATQLF